MQTPATLAPCLNNKTMMLETANILFQPAGHAPPQMRVEVSGECGAALVIFSALNPCQKLHGALAAEIVQNRFRIRGKLIWMMLIRHQAVKLRRGFLGDAQCGLRLPIAAW